MIHTPVARIADVEVIELPGAGSVEMTLQDMCKAFGVPWSDVRARLIEAGSDTAGQNDREARQEARQDARDGDSDGAR